MFGKCAYVRLPGNLLLGTAEVARIDLHLCPLVLGSSCKWLGAKRTRETPGLFVVYERVIPAASGQMSRSFICALGTEELTVLKICR